MKRSFWRSVDRYLSTMVILLFVFQIFDILVLSSGAHGVFTRREMDDNLCVSGFILVLTVLKAALWPRLRAGGEYFLLTVGALAFAIWLSLANLALPGAAESGFAADGVRTMRLLGLASASAVVVLQLARSARAHFGRRAGQRDTRALRPD